MIERAADAGGRRVVHDQRNAERRADCGDFGDWEDVQLRVRQGLGVVGAGLVIRCGAEGLWVGRVDEADLDAHVLHGVGEKVIGPAIKVRRGHDVVARLRNILHGIGARGLAGRDGKRCRAAFHRCNALLQHIAGRVHDAGVDVAKLSQREQVRGVLGVPELEGRRLVDRHGDGPGVFGSARWPACRTMVERFLGALLIRSSPEAVARACSTHARPLC